MIDTYYYTSPIGGFKITADGDGVLSCRPVSDVEHNINFHNSHIQDAIRWLDAYFLGDFSQPIPSISAPLTSCQWDLVKIPAGHTKQYGHIKTPKHARAYGRACATNPIYVMIPCHRVVSANGGVQYGGGAEMKLWLLRHEGAVLS